jgi:secreted trypsin-like serine protease
VCSGELVGIVSDSTNCGKDKKPSVYTEVYKYSGWIQTTIQSINSAAVTTLSIFLIIAMPVGLLSYWKGTA